MSKLYFWGKSITPSFKNKPIKKMTIQSLNSEKVIMEIQCGAEHCIIRTQDNEIYGFGSN